MGQELRRLAKVVILVFHKINHKVTYEEHVIKKYSFHRFSSIKPNSTHQILKKLEGLNKVRCIVTQNVDNLHTKAGSRKVIELHGTAFRVMCLSCNEKICRYYLQEIFDKINPNMTATSQMIRPDGDVDLSQVNNKYLRSFKDNLRSFD